MTNGPWLLVKFGKHHHIESLQNGLVYMNPWEYFRQVENVEQKDISEGIDVWFNPDTTDIMLDGHKFTKNSGTVSASLSSEHNTIKIFCATLISRRDSIREDLKILDDRVKDFGESYLVIYNLKEFFSRLLVALERDKTLGKIVEYESKKIKYVDQEFYDGDFGPFRKFSQFRHQKEWRLAIQSKTLNEYRLDIQDIADISELGKTDKFINKIEKTIDGNHYQLKFS